MGCGRREEKGGGLGGKGEMWGNEEGEGEVGGMGGRLWSPTTKSCCVFAGFFFFFCLDRSVWFGDGYYPHLMIPFPHFLWQKPECEE